jgi:lipopolysaccharide/colanic/teichoic acid biosynthesis glycosyltransferase
VKRLLDIFLALAGLLAVAPLLLPVLLLVWMQDWHSPFYIANRVGLARRPFRMVKLRSMVVNADRAGVDSTAGDDARITPLGHFIRNYKLDELTQLWNVMVGDMSLVGPRPNVLREVDLYTAMECRLLDVRPGITDFASIVFADEGEILRDRADPDIAYNQLIRPWKSRLGLFYVDHSSLGLDLRLIGLTMLALVSRRQALDKLSALLTKLGADAELCRVAARREPLQACPPPGTEHIVMSRAAPLGTGG